MDNKTETEASRQEGVVRPFFQTLLRYKLQLRNNLQLQRLLTTRYETHTKEGARTGQPGTRLGG